MFDLNLNYYDYSAAIFRRKDMFKLLCLSSRKALTCADMCTHGSSVAGCDATYPHFFPSQRSAALSWREGLVPGLDRGSQVPTIVCETVNRAARFQDRGRTPTMFPTLEPTYAPEAITAGKPGLECPEQGECPTGLVGFGGSLERRLVNFGPLQMGLRAQTRTSPDV